MNDIFVNGKKLRKERDTSSKEYKEAVIRDYVKAHPGEVLKIEDFTKALDGLTTASTIVKKLVDSGKLIRRSAPVKGKAYTYQWSYDMPTTAFTSKQTNSPPRTVKTFYATELQLKKLDDWYMDYCNSEDSVDGANHFRKFIHNKAKEDNDV